MEQSDYASVIRRNKSDDEIAIINHEALWTAMDALYDTHVVTEGAAAARGRAIQALEEIWHALGFEGSLFTQFEQIPISRRRRESSRWQTHGVA